MKQQFRYDTYPVNNALTLQAYDIDVRSRRNPGISLNATSLRAFFWLINKFAVRRVCIMGIMSDRKMDKYVSLLAEIPVMN
jgi:hypothetical protein